MVPIRSPHARRRLRTVLVAAPFLVAGVAFTSFGTAQDLPGVVATDLFEQAIQEPIAVPSADDGGQASIPTTWAWIVALVAAALVIYRLRGSLPRYARRERGETTHSAPEPPRSVASDVEATRATRVVAFRARKPSKPPEVLKLPAHVVAILEKSAAARAAGRAVLGPESPVGPRRRRHVDVTVPRYDPSRSED